MNYFKTAILLGAMTALFTVVGFAIGGQTGMMIAFVIAVGHEFLFLLECRQDGFAHAWRARS